MQHVLDNPAWNALISGNSKLSNGNETVKYFDKEVSPFVGFKHNADSDFEILYDILPHSGPVGFVGAVERQLPKQWELIQYIKCAQMIFHDTAAPANVNEKLVLLTQEHVPQMLALTKLTNPGPFALRTIEFGHYYGIFDGDQLIAMAGQRMNPSPYAEISAVCTHPDYLGKGYAKQLLLFHINRIIAAGNTPMLHVRHDNERAIKVYESVGFAIRRELHFYIMKKVV
jgi:predicted GNAT family acetyltransferase